MIVEVEICADVVVFVVVGVVGAVERVTAALTVFLLCFFVLFLKPCPSYFDKVRVGGV